ncbi:HAD family hydrolase [Acetivibrio cellulolyticus]|uniref:HAD family hydrolase n=1 Tax=Acetivibrio cellulolyticus TaxID=35830 RepID=UPI0001E2EB5D|nr:HAD family phosphatase [Acetivibrio cellulolyticus]
MDNKFEYILFDLGGVLIELTLQDKMLDWMEHKISLDEFNKMWLLSKSVRAFESGLINSSEFARSIIEEFNLPVDEQEFISEFVNFTKGFFDGMEDLLKKLSKEYTLACLSNTNELHWDKLCKQYDMDGLITHNFLSYKTGINKPDKEAFLNVVKVLDTQASRILFFDDNSINVEAAQKVGMTAYRVCGYEDIISVLKELNVI